MEPWKPPAWLTVLSEDDLLFLKRFLLASGSLKHLASLYGVSYPTIRARLDRTIDKVNAAESPDATDSFERLIDLLVEQGVMLAGTARTLVQTHKRIIRDVAERAERAATQELRPDFPPDGWQE